MQNAGYIQTETPTHTHTQTQARAHTHTHTHRERERERERERDAYTYTYTHQEAWMKTTTKINYENHTCHTRGHPPVVGCSPIKCARAVIDDFISHDECKFRVRGAGCRVCPNSLVYF